MANTVSAVHGACRVPGRTPRGDHEVLADGEALEHAAALRHERDPARGDRFRRQTRHRRAEHLDAASARRQQADAHVHAGRFAGAVAAEQAE